MKTITRILLVISLILTYGLSALNAQDLHVYVAAHPDDWQLFMNPNAFNSVANTNNKVLFLHITSGDGGRGAGINQYFKSREEGSKRGIRFSVNANSDVEGLGSILDTITTTVNGHTIARFGYGNTVTVFLRLPDGNIDGAGYPITNYQSIQRLFDGSIPSITTIEGDTYTGLSDLETTIRQLIELEAETYEDIEFNVAETESDLNPGDHSDHRYASFIMQNVATQMGSVTVNLYQEYVTSAREVNVTGNELYANAATWGATVSGLTDMKAHGTYDDVHNAWLDRQYYRVIEAADVEAPSIPTNLQAAAISGSSINLSWTASTDNGLVAGYNIYRDGSLITTTTLTSYTDNNLETIITYSYSVSAFDAANNVSGLSSAVNATTLDDVAPSTPTDFTAVATTASSVDLNWTASTDNVGITGYNIYRNDVLIGNTASINYTDATVTPGNTYLYSVSAYDAEGNQSVLTTSLSVSPVDVTAPSIPAGLQGIAETTRSINLSWEAATDDIEVVGYNIYRDNVLIANTSVLTFTDNGLTAGTLYEYRVSAYDAAGNQGELSAIVQVTTLVSTDTEAPTVPTNLVIEGIAATSIEISWTASTDNDEVFGYNIYRNGTLLTTTSATSYTDSTLSSGVTYSFSVSAIDLAENESALSTTVSATTLDNIPPATPANVQSTGIAATSISLSWSESIDNVATSGYNIYRDNVFVTSTTALNYTDNTLVSGTTYNYSISAFDISGNESPLSSALSITTLDNVAPSTPTALVATATSTSTISLSWTASTDNVAVTDYTIFRDGALLTTTAATSFVDNSLLTGTSYTYSVAANDLAGNQSAFSTEASATTSTVPVNLALNRPTSASAFEFGHESSFAVDGINSTSSWWGANPFSQWWQVDLEAEYNLTSVVLINYYDGSRYYRYDIQGSTDGSTWTTLVDNNANTTAATSIGNTYTINNTTVRYIRVNMNYNSANEGVHIIEFEAYGSPAGSNPPSGDLDPPTTPTGLTGTAISSSAIDIDWSASTDNIGVTGYNIYRNGSLISSTTSTSYSDVSLLPSTTYIYAISAVDAAGNQSSLSGTTSITTLVSTDTEQPSTPAGLTAIASSSSTINLNWSASTDNVGVTGYNIYRDGSFLANTASTSYSDNGLTPETQYSYYVSAVDLAGNESNFSTTANATTLIQTTNIALNRPTTASSYEGGNTSALAVDGINSTTSWWGASPFPQWWQVDLEDEYDLSSVVVVNYYDGSRYYQYDIQVSIDGTNWTTIVDFNTNTTPATSEGNSFVTTATARYIRVNMNYNSANEGVHIIEFEAYGSLSATATPMAAMSISEPISNTQSTSGIEEVSAQEEFFTSAYPNPVNVGDPITLLFELPIDGNVQVNILSISGSTVYSNEHFLFSGSNELVIDLFNASAGSYVVIATYNGVSESRQILIE